MTGRPDRRALLAGLAATGLVACRRQEEAQTAPYVDHRLNAETLDLSDLEQAHGGRIGLYALEDKAVAWRAMERFNYCSTFKLFLAAATLERVSRGEEDLSRAIPISAADMVPHAPITQPAIGKTLTVEQLCQAVVEVSDNPAANLLIKAYGGLDAWRGYFRAIGDETTTVDRLEPLMNRPEGTKDTAQPRQTVMNLDWLWTTYQPLTLLSPHKPLWTWLIDSPTGQNRLKAGAPEGWTVAHKTGTGGAGQTNDIGFIHPPQGDPIKIAVYYDAPATLDVDAREGVIAETTRRVMKAMGRG